MDTNGIAAKLARARRHVDEVRDGVAAFLETHPYTVTRHLEDEGATHSYRFSKYEDAPPLLLAAAGDAIHNMRSALDHTAVALSRAGSASLGSPLSAEEERRIYFPVKTSRKEFDAAALRSLCRVAPDAVEVIASVQPFGEEPEHHPLWCVHELDNRDKHRELNILAAIASIQGPPVPAGIPPYLSDAHSDGTWGEGSHVITFRFPKPQPDVDLQYEPRFRASLEGAWPPTQPVDEVLCEYLDWIERWVIPYLLPWAG